MNNQELLERLSKWVSDPKTIAGVNMCHSGGPVDKRPTAQGIAKGDALRQQAAALILKLAESTEADAWATMVRDTAFDTDLGAIHRGDISSTVTAADRKNRPTLSDSDFLESRRIQWMITHLPVHGLYRQHYLVRGYRSDHESNLDTLLDSAYTPEGEYLKIMQESGLTAVARIPGARAA